MCVSLVNPCPDAGADMEFLRAAFAISQHSIYSLHKSSTRDHIMRVASRELGSPAGATVVVMCHWHQPLSMPMVAVSILYSFFPVHPCSQGAGPAAVRLARLLCFPQAAQPRH